MATGSVSAGGDISGFVNTGTIIFYATGSRQDGSGFAANIPPLPHIHQPRKNEIIKVKKLLNGSGGGVSAITSVHGWPGVGKTTFLTELAHEKDLWKRFTDGIIWISLGQNPDTLDLLTRFATGLGFDKNQFANPDTNSLIRAIHSRIVQKKFLVLIDDAWNSSHVTPFLFGGCDCACLVATRSPVVAKDISPENTYTLEEMSEKEGMRLFAKLAPSVANTYGKECADLLKQLTFLPLIIKITGKMLNTARSKGRNIPELIKGLKADSAAIINAETPDDVQRESNAKVVSMLIGRSLNLLDERERRLFAMLSVFGEKPIHYDLDAIKAVWGVQDTEPVKDKLIELGLLELESEDTHRYQMHSLLVKYGYELLKQVTTKYPEELRNAHIRHAEHYHRVLWTLNDLYFKGGDSMMKALRDFDNIEWPNIQRAQQWAERNWKKQNGSIDLDVAEILANFPSSGANILGLRLHSRELIAWLETALKALEESFKMFSYDIPKRVKTHKSALLGNLGIVYDSISDYRKAIDHFMSALTIALENRDRRGEHQNLVSLGNTYASLGEYRKAIEYHEQALKISRGIGSKQLEGNTLGNLGIAYDCLGKYPKAMEYYKQALTISKEIGHKELESNTLGNLGNAYASLGDYPKAIEYYEQALKIMREIGDRRGEGDTCHNLAVALAEIGKTAGALEYAKRAVKILESIESPTAKAARELRIVLEVSSVDKR